MFFFSYKKALFIFSLINYTSLTYKNGEYQYPSWAHIIGWIFVAASLGCIPVFAVISILQSDGHTFGQVKTSIGNDYVLWSYSIYSFSQLWKRFVFEKNGRKYNDQSILFIIAEIKCQITISHTQFIWFLVSFFFSSKTICNTYWMAFFSQNLKKKQFPETTKCNQTKYTRV